MRSTILGILPNRTSLFMLLNFEGKSTLINILVGQDVLPTGMLKTTGAVIELRHADKWSFSVMESCGTSDFIDQPMDFDHFLDKPSMAFKAFGLNESSCWPFVRVRLEYPLPLLSSGIVIYDSPGLKDTDELTEAVVQNMRTCQAFIHVLNRGLTAASTQMLERLLALGRKPASIFFAITHMEDYSSDKKTDTINKLRNDLEAIDADFNSSEIVILDARRAFDVLIRYQLYTKECADFLCRISPFFCRILSFKYHSFSERLGKIFAGVYLLNSSGYTLCFRQCLSTTVKLCGDESISS